MSDFIASRVLHKIAAGSKVKNPTQEDVDRALLEAAAEVGREIGEEMTHLARFVTGETMEPIQ